MAELEEKLNAILSDPEAMGQIVAIAKALTGESGSEPARDKPPTGEESPAGEAGPSASEEQGADLSALSALLGNLSGGGGNPLSALGELDPRLIRAAVTLYSEYNATDDRKLALLSALKPFLKEARIAKMDKAIQIAKLSRVIRVAFQWFKKEGGEGDV